MDVTSTSTLPPPRIATAHAIAPGVRPILPVAPAKPAPAFERRDPDLSSRRAVRPGDRRVVRRSRPHGRVYLFVGVLFLAASAIGYVAFREYVYGDMPPTPVDEPTVYEIEPVTPIVIDAP